MNPRTRTPGRRTQRWVIIAVAPLVLLGCNGSTDPDPTATNRATGQETTVGTDPSSAATDAENTDATNTDATNTDATNAAATNADEALARAGLELPPGAEDVTFAAVSDPQAGFAEHYRVTFAAPTDMALRLCDGRGLPAVTLTATDHARLGPDAAVTPETRYCSSADPQDQRWIRTVLVEPGDSAHAIVSIGQLPD